MSALLHRADGETVARAIRLPCCFLRLSCDWPQERLLNEINSFGWKTAFPAIPAAAGRGEV